MSSFTLKQIRYFVAAAETGQISRAAAELNVTQSAVTIAIRQLEDQLGLDLFRRSSAGVTVTQEGAELLRLGRDMLATAEQARHLKRSQGHDTSGELRVGITYTVAGYFLTALLTRFNRIYPNITVRLYENSRALVQKSLIDGELDLALGMLEHSDAIVDLNATILHRSKRRLWLAANHRLLEAPSLSLQSIMREPYIGLTIDGALTNTMRFWNSVGLQPNFIFQTSSLEAIRTMVGSGMGVTILSDMVYRPWSLDGQRIETRDIDGDIPTVNVTVLTPQNRPLSSAGMAFRTFLERGHSGV